MAQIIIILAVSRLHTRVVADVTVSRSRKRRAGGMYTCRVQFRRPRIVVPLEMKNNFSELHMSPNIPAYDVCLSSADCASSMKILLLAHSAATKSSKIPPHFKRVAIQSVLFEIVMSENYHAICMHWSAVLLKGRWTAKISTAAILHKMCLYVYLPTYAINFGIVCKQYQKIFF